MTLYYILAILGAMMLLISVFSGVDHHIDIGADAHDFDASHDASVNDSPAILSIRTMSAFILAFGVAGIICVSLGKGIGAQLICGFMAGGFAVFLTWGILKIFHSQQGFSTFNINSMVGTACSVTCGTTLSGIASVRIITPEGAREYMCKEINKETLDRNDIVTITGIQDSIILVSKTKLDEEKLSEEESLKIKEAEFISDQPSVKEVLQPSTTEPIVKVETKPELIVKSQDNKSKKRGRKPLKK